MSVHNEALLDQFRGPGPCERCRRVFPRLEPHHLLTRGAGQADIPCNLAALCHWCHRSVATSSKVRRAVCSREGVTEEEIEAAVWEARRQQQLTPPPRPDPADQVARTRAELEALEREARRAFGARDYVAVDPRLLLVLFALAHRR